LCQLCGGEAPKQRNRRYENEQIKHGEVPRVSPGKPLRHCQKELVARWTQKNDVSYFGYKRDLDSIVIALTVMSEDWL
ncbi:MAG: hypothetical protein ACQKBW_10670, partial [Puniceicoccales bacterium]